MTVGFSGIAAIVLPNFPATTKWLIEEERQYAVRHLEEVNNATNAGDISHSRSIILAVRGGGKQVQSLSSTVISDSMSSNMTT